MEFTEEYLGYMRLAIAKGKQSISEDSRLHPKVGAVLIRDGDLLDYAYRGEMNDGDHAEYTLLEKKLKGENLSGTILFTTLEPCTKRQNHTPCSHWILEKGINEVYIGIPDPNPKIYMQGYKKLKEEGVIIRFFPSQLRDEIKLDNKAFIDQFEMKSALSDQVSFDYTNNNGIYTIGEGNFVFETMWGGGSGRSIWAYSDTPSIDSVAIAEGAQNLNDVVDAGIYNSSSRYRRAKEGDFLILKNSSGYYAAIQVITIEAVETGSEHNEIVFRYWIHKDGGVDFSMLG